MTPEAPAAVGGASARFSHPTSHSHLRPPRGPTAASLCAALSWKQPLPTLTPVTLTLRERNKHSRSPRLVVTTHSRIHTGPPTRHQQPSGKHGSARNQLIELRTFPETIPHEERNAKLTAHINTAAPAGTQRAASPAGCRSAPTPRRSVRARHNAGRWRRHPIPAGLRSAPQPARPPAPAAAVPPAASPQRGRQREGTRLQPRVGLAPATGRCSRRTAPPRAPRCLWGGGRRRRLSGVLSPRSRRPAARAAQAPPAAAAAPLPPALPRGHVRRVHSSPPSLPLSGAPHPLPQAGLPAGTLSPC